MKSRIWYTLMLATVLVAAATFGEIIPSGDGTSISASASASKGNPEYYEYYERWWQETTTEAGTFQWYIEADAYARCSAFKGNGWVLAVADASGAAASPYDVVSVDAYMSLDYTDDDEVHDPPKDSNEGTGYFSAYQSVSAQCDAFAYAGIEEGSTSSASSSSDSVGYPTLSGS